MSQAIREILKSIADFDKTSDSYALDLRMSLSRLIIAELRRIGLSQRELAKRTRRKESFVSRIIHGDDNCTLKTVADMLFALGIRGTIAAQQEEQDYVRITTFTLGMDVAEYATKVTQQIASNSTGPLGDYTVQQASSGRIPPPRTSDTA